MADNVTTQSPAPSTVPSGTVIATDQLGTGEHVQFVKIMDGTLDGTTKALVTADGLATATGGKAATDAAVSGNPQQDGGRASYPAIAPAMSADGDAVPVWLDRSGAMIVRKRPVAMYSAHYRAINSTGGARGLASGVLTANVNKQILTIHHRSIDVKRVAIKKIIVTLRVISTAAGIIEMDVTPLSATTLPATGNPTITPGKHDQADAAAETTCLALPTTQGSVVNADATVGLGFYEDLGITAAAGTANPIPYPMNFTLWDSQVDGDGKDLILRPSVAEGYAVNIRSSAGSNVGFLAYVVFTEE